MLGLMMGLDTIQTDSAFPPEPPRHTEEAGATEMPKTS